MVKNKEKIRTIGVPLPDNESDLLDTLKSSGLQIGHWVAQAIREKLEREGLLDRQDSQEEDHSSKAEGDS